MSSSDESSSEEFQFEPDIANFFADLREDEDKHSSADEKYDSSNDHIKRAYQPCRWWDKGKNNGFKREDPNNTWNDVNKYIKQNVKSKVDDKISKARSKFIKEKLKKDNTDGIDSGSEEEEDWKNMTVDEISLSEDELQKDTIKIKQDKPLKSSKKKKGIEKMNKSSDEEDANDADAKDEKKDILENINSINEIKTFKQLCLHPLLLKAIRSMGYKKPTPIQSATIPSALLNKDICGCAATGTGKTAAYMIPILYRLILKPKSQKSVTRVLILVPTRELGVQVYSVTKELAQFTSNIDIALAVGGLNVKVQEKALETSPDIVISTPGRLIEHCKNVSTFTLNLVEILVLDEADRMLDEHFQEQMKEILRQIPKARQTLLFSATINDAITHLVPLNDPVRIFVDSNTNVAFNLRQEFIRLRKDSSIVREAILGALVCRIFHDHTMVFVRTKKDAHRTRILLGLLGLKVVEVHGNMTQPQRLEALRKFRDEEVNILVATDVAARGLDITGVKAVINLMLPSTLEHYIHRVGRTARAGQAGVSVSLCGPSSNERKMVKEITKRAHNPVIRRLIPNKIIEKYRKKIVDLEDYIKAILQEEYEDRVLQRSDNHSNLTTSEKKVSENNQKADKQEGKNLSQINHQERLKITGKEVESDKKTDKYYEAIAKRNNKSNKKKNFIPDNESPEEKLKRENLKFAYLCAKSVKSRKRSKSMTVKNNKNFNVNRFKSGKRKYSSGVSGDDSIFSSAGFDSSSKRKKLRHKTNLRIRNQRKGRNT